MVSEERTWYLYRGRGLLEVAGPIGRGQRVVGGSEWVGRCGGWRHIRQETVRIIKTASRTRDNLTKTERAALRTLKNNTHLTILPTDKGNATVILNTTDYKQKIASLLEDYAYKKLTKDPTDSIELKTKQLLKKSSLTEDLCKQLRPAGS